MGMGTDMGTEEAGTTIADRAPMEADSYSVETGPHLTDPAPLPLESREALTVSASASRIPTAETDLNLGLVTQSPHEREGNQRSLFPRCVLARTFVPGPRPFRGKHPNLFAILACSAREPRRVGSRNQRPAPLIVLRQIGTLRARFHHHRKEPDKVLLFLS